MTKQLTQFSAPWSLHFDRDGTEDVAIICDVDGDDIASSRHFWLPEGNDEIPLTLASIRAMAAAPELLEAVTLLIRLVHRLLPRHAQSDSMLDNLPEILRARAALAKATFFNPSKGIKL
jgi:hypothetical protein